MSTGSGRIHADVIANNPDGIWAFDRSRRVTVWNPVMGRTTGVPAERVLGRRADEAFPFMLETGEIAYLVAALAGERGVLPAQSNRFTSGRDGAYQATYTPLRDETGDIVGGLCVVRDVSALQAAEAALRHSEERLRLALNAANVATWDYNPATGAVIRSEGMAALFGYPPGALDDPSVDPLERIHPEDRHLIEDADAHHFATGDDYRVEYRVVLPDGRTRWLRERGHAVTDAPEPAQRLLGVTMDVTTEKQAEQELRRREAEFRLLFAAHPHPMWVFDHETLRFLEVNDAAVASYGYDRDEFLAMTIVDIRPAEDVPRLLTDMSRVRTPLRPGSNWRHRRKDGTLVDVEVASHLLTFGGRPATLVVAQDVTERRRLEAELAYHASHDSLTGLPNRAMFLDYLGAALRHGIPVAVLFIDLDNFKVVNDTLGHRAGDDLLRGVAERLRRRLGAGDMLARLGGDEFTLLREGVATQSGARDLAELVAEELRMPFDIDGRSIYATPSVGIALATEPGASPDDVLRAADVAMYAAKQSGKARWAMFDAGMDQRAWRRLEMEADLRRAIAQDEMRIHYQPVVDLRTGRMVQVEALVRWEHPKHGLVLPGDFVPLAEETGLIVPIGRWVLRRSCAQVRLWRQTWPEAAELGLAVNLSPRQFQDPYLVADVERALAESQLDAAALQLEITETAALEDLSGTAAVEALRALGVRIALDDFGAGYAGLGYLRQLPIDDLKIDRSYIAGLGLDVGETAMVQAVVTFARALGMGVIAEGVETAHQRDELVHLGCQRAQGYLFDRPMPPEDMMSRFAAAVA